MPDWFTSLFARLFGNEPLVKIMYSIIVWALVLLVCPAALSEKIQLKSGIPYFYPVVMFAIAFVLVDIAHRAYKIYRQILRHLLEAFRLEAQQNLNNSAIVSMEKVIEGLNPDEREFLAAMVEDGIFDVSLRRGDRLSQSLCEKGILVNTGPSAFDRRQDSLVISEKFQALLYKKLSSG